MACPVVFITGSESGIGAACAERLAQDGYRLCLGYRDDAEAAAEIADRCRKAGVEATAYCCDIADRLSVEAAFAQMVADRAVPTHLLHSAGVGGPPGATADNDPDAWQHTLTVNLTGAFNVAAAFRNAGRPTGSGSFDRAALFVSSIHAMRGGAGGAAYSASKAGLERLVESLALEWAAQGIRVNALRPGMVWTAMNDALDPDARAAAEALVPLGRGAKASEIADVAAFLLSDRAAYVTGAALTVDGGLSLTAGKGA